MINRDDYLETDLSVFDTWEQEASALDNSALASLEDQMGWPVEKITSLLMQSAASEESSRLETLRNDNAESSVITTELPRENRELITNLGQR